MNNTTRSRALIRSIAAAGALALVAGTSAQVTIDRADYERRLRGMWLGECIANWTGLQTEGVRPAPPFFTDADWEPPLGTGGYHFVLQDPWFADDDTDIEYVYLHLMTQHQTTTLTPVQIRDGWIDHVNTFIWVSNAEARRIMGTYGLCPPITGMGHANVGSSMIDAQLTTEFFGALAPGMPHKALAMADLPIHTTADGQAAHAAQFFAVLYSLATQVPAGLSPRDRALWLIDHARAYIPDSSKTAGIVDFVRNSYLTNPNPGNWAYTRDAIADRYQTNAFNNGFIFRAWFESSVNFANGVMLLLYSEGDFKRALQIGTLGGWDSDNPTATMGGLYGLMLGDDGIAAQFPGVTLSRRFWIRRTRPTMPDFLPDDPQAEDTFDMMAQRMLPIIDRAVQEAGGTVGATAWTLPTPPSGTPLSQNPMEAQRALSVSQKLQHMGIGVTPITNGVVLGESWRILHLNNGDVPDMYGAEPWYGSHGNAEIVVGSGELWLGVTWPSPQNVAAVRFIKGPLVNELPTGFDTVRPQVLVDGVWIDPPSGFTVPGGISRAMPYEIVDLVLGEPMLATGVRVVGSGPMPLHVTCSEMDALSAVIVAPCAANCDGSTATPLLTASDFTCFLAKFRAGDAYANCDGSTGSPALTASDFTCFLSKFRAGCP